MFTPVLGITKKDFVSRVWPAFAQCAQAHRKPRWLPVAKSKIYRIPKRPVVSEEERIELLRINNNYHTQMRAIRQFYHNEMIREKSSRESTSSEESVNREAEDWVQCVALNEEWNVEVSLGREQRRAQQLEEMKQYAIARMEAKDRELREEIEKASKEIKKQKELSTTFITPETLDAAIDHALANITDYNFAIDLKEQLHHGRDTPPLLTEKAKSINNT